MNAYMSELKRQLNKQLKCLQGIIFIAKKIEDVIPEMCTSSASDAVFFSSVIFFIEIQHMVKVLFHQPKTDFVTRLCLSLEIWLKACFTSLHTRNPHCQQKWRDYAIYEDFQKALKDGPEAAAQMLAETASEIGREVIERARSEFDFCKSQIWHKSTVRQLVDAQ